MTRFITIEDDEGGPTARLVVRNSAITEIRIGTDFIDGLPDDIIAALLPFVGLPAVGVRRNGAARQQSRSKIPATLDPPGWPAPSPSAVAEAAAALSEQPSVAGAPAVDFIAAGEEGLREGLRNGQRRLESALQPVPDIPTQPQPEPKAKRVALNRQGTRTAAPKARKGQGRKWPVPSDEEFAKAIGELGASPSKLGQRFKTPPGTVSIWLRDWRQREK